MKLIKILTAALLISLTACDEFTPVFTGKYEEPEIEKIYTDEDFEGATHISIKALKDMYAANDNKPVTVTENVYIKGQVISSDEEGNFYKGFVIQDSEGGIEIKAGLTGLYNEYKLGQWVYVLCKGLTVGDYEGTKQLGYEDSTHEYETAYIAQRPLLNKHVKKGIIGDPVEPKVVTYKECEDHLGCYVTIEGLKYNKEIFCLAYIDPNQNHKDLANRVFLSDKAWGVDTWAMSQNQFKKNLNEGKFDAASKASDSKVTVKSLRAAGKMGTSAYSVTQYFKFSTGEPLGIRSSGYSRFSDTPIDAAVLAGTQKIDVTGVLTKYEDEYQFTLIDLNGIKNSAE